jgi:hypothetical protein
MPVTEALALSKRIEVEKLNSLAFQTFSSGNEEKIQI